MSTIEKLTMKINTLNRQRTIRVYLPSDYDTTSKKFDVLYMHDGHNLFSVESSGYGQIWNAHKTLDDFEENNGFNIILVGIDCDPYHRFDEYSPWKSTKTNKIIPDLNMELCGGEGDLYLEWIVNNLIPEINKRFRTSGRNYLAGSSMGAFISLYASLKYKNIFRKVGCLSTAFWFKKSKMIRFIKNNFNPDLGIYLDVGTNEGQDSENPVSKLYINDTKEIYNLLKTLGTKNLKLYIDEGGIHSEKSWSKRFPKFINWLLL